MYSVNFYSEAKTSDIPFTKVVNDDNDDKDDPNYGHRLPSRNIIGYIDFDTYSIILPGEIAETVLYYELWSDDTCIFQTVDENELISELLDLDTDYVTIVITTPDYKLIGVYLPSD